MLAFIGCISKGCNILINHEQIGEGQDVICLHGWGGCCDSFRGLSNFLSSNFRVTLVDFYGFGKTPHPINVLKIDDYALSIVKIIHYYKMKNVILVCHSFGGRVGIKLAVKYGYLINKLILIDSAGIKPRRGLKYYFSIYKHKLLNLLKIKHVAGSEDYKKLSETMRGTFKNVINEDLCPILKKIKTQTLIIWGEKDKETPIYMAKKMKKKIADSGLIIFENCGHYAYIERHKVFCIIIKNYLLGENNAFSKYNNIRDNNFSSTIKIPYDITK